MQQLKNFILVKNGAVGIVYINRPEIANSFNMEMFNELGLISSQIEEDTDLLCIVLTGAGKHFCAGLDHSVSKKLTPEFSMRKVNQEIHANFFRWENLTQPTIAAINGACIGGGFEFALTCDIRISSADAIFSTPGVSFGFSPTMGGSQRLPRVVGASQAKKLLMCCEKIGAQEALRIGAVDEVIEAENLLERAMELANKIAAQPPMAVKFAKKAVNLAMESSLQAGMLLEQVQSICLLGSEDRRKVSKAYREKRTPHFNGR